MRTFLTGCLFALSTAATVSCGNGGNTDVKSVLADTASYTTIEWLDSMSRNYGTVAEGQLLHVSFRFRNSGTTPLVITSVRPSCGCTIAEQPRKPIPPGEEGQIKASFNSQGRTGVNHKTLFVNANTRGTQNYSLQFVVQVDKKPS